MMGFWTEVT